MIPLLSIVIANYNYGRFLEDAIQSVVAQIGVGEDKVIPDEVELIIIDGGSTDNSVEVIKKYALGLPADVRKDAPSAVHLHLSPTPITYWVSEKDKGQSDAFNKGFAHARGRFGCWLNADDILIPGALCVVLAYINRHPDAEWICGSSVFVDCNLNVKWCSRCVRTWPLFHKRIPWYAINGPSSFFLIENLKQVGGFDVGLRYTMDTDLWRRFVAADIRPHFVKEYIWCFRVHEESKTSHKFITGKGHGDFADEGRKMNARYGISSWVNKFGGRLNQIARLISGTYLWSYIDTYRARGRNVMVLRGGVA